MQTLDEAFSRVQQFKQSSFRRTIGALEASLKGYSSAQHKPTYPGTAYRARAFTLSIAVEAGDESSERGGHSVGILVSLLRILEPEEAVEYLSLAAGNTGRPFDLETNYRIAEFKFIDWKGGPESIRQNSLFKDLFDLVEYPTKKRKYLYVVGLEYPLKFFTGGRACASVMSRNLQLWKAFTTRYGDQYSTVRDFYDAKKSDVQLVDLTRIIPELATLV